MAVEMGAGVDAALNGTRWWSDSGDSDAVVDDIVFMTDSYSSSYSGSYSGSDADEQSALAAAVDKCNGCGSAEELASPIAKDDDVQGVREEPSLRWLRANASLWRFDDTWVHAAGSLPKPVFWLRRPQRAARSSDAESANKKKRGKKMMKKRRIDAMAAYRRSRDSTCSSCGVGSGASAVVNKGVDQACAEAAPYLPSSLKACTGCRRAFYCGTACQNAHWPLHRSFCRGAKSRQVALEVRRATFALYDEQLFGRSTAENPQPAYEALADVLRVRATYVHEMSGAAIGPFDPDEASARKYVERFVRKAARRDYTPLWWTPENSAAAVRFMTEGSEAYQRFHICTPISADIIQARWGTDKDEFELAGLLRQFGDLVESPLRMIQRPDIFFRRLCTLNGDQD